MEANIMFVTMVVFAYVSPETVLPVTSVLAALLGVVMMFGRTTFRFIVQKILLATFRKPPGKI